MATRAKASRTPVTPIDLAAIEVPTTEIIDVATVRYTEFLIASNERAVPDVRDGLKPVHRRVLLSFKDLGASATGRHFKSAKVVGDCFAAGTMVSTIDGLRRIEEIEVGDFVRGPDGSAVRVSETYMNPPKPMVRVHFASGQSLDVTPDQLFQVVNEDLEIEWRPAYELKDRLALALGHGVDIAHRASNELARAAYVMGLFVAEGFAVDRDRAVDRRVRITMTDLEPLAVVEAWAKHVGTTCHKSMRRPAREYWKDQCVLTLAHNEDLLEAAGSLSDKKRIPRSVLSRREAWAPFLAGLLDGDGHVSRRGRTRRIQFATTSPQLVHDLQSIMSAIGIRTRLYRFGHRPEHLEPLSIEITGADALRLAAFIAPFVRIERKAQALVGIVDPAIRRGIQGNDLVPMRTVWESLSKAHLGGGWFATAADGTKFRMPLDAPGQADIRYGRQSNTRALLTDRSFPISRALAQGWDLKLDRIGSSVGDKLRKLRGMSVLRVTEVESLAEPTINYDIQVESEDHAFIAEGLVVHNCMGKYHPHGNMSIYDAAVKMAQDWAMRYPLIDFPGNKGSIGGAGAAADRYTEMRPSFVGDELLRDLENRAAGIVEWGGNFTNEEDEPHALAGRFPQLLANGILTGIGTGYSAMWLPHNLREVIDAITAIIDDPSIQAADLIKHIKGPDFATGGIVMGLDGFKEALATGKGTVTVRAKLAVEENGRDQAVVITEIPWQKEKDDLIESIIKTTIKDKNGKAPIEGIIDCVDESGNDWRTDMRIVVSLRRDANPKVVANLLYKLTGLQTSFTYNQMAYMGDADLSKQIMPNAYPTLLNMKQVIDAYVAYQFGILTRRTQWRRKKAQDALIIQEAYLLADKYADKLVPAARASAGRSDLEAKIPSIIPEIGKATPDIAKRQSEIIAGFPLYRFSKIDTKTVRERIAELKAEIAEYDRLLATRQAMLDLLKAELKELRTRYGDERRTEINVGDSGEIKSIEELIHDEPCWLTVARSGLVARHPQSAFRAQKRGGSGVNAAKSEDDPIVQALAARTRDKVWLITDAGNLYGARVIDLDEVPRGGRGTNVKRFLTMSGSETVVRVIVPPADAAGELILATAGGRILRSRFSDYANLRADGLKAIKLVDDDKIVSVAIAAEGMHVIAVSSDGYAARFDLSAVPIQGRGSQGVAAMSLSKGARVVSLTPIAAEDERDLALVLTNGRGKRSRLVDYPVKGRAIRGVTTVDIGTASKGKDAVEVAFAAPVGDEDQVVFVASSGKVLVLSATEIKRQGRATAGVITVSLSESKAAPETVVSGTVA